MSKEKDKLKEAVATPTEEVVEVAEAIEDKKEITSEDILKLMKLPEYESNFTLDDMLSVNDYRTQSTIKIKYVDPNDGVTRDVTKCDVSDERIALYGLSLGLTSIGGTAVNEDNLMDLLVENLNILPTDLIRLYNDMMSKHLKKKL